MITIPLLGRMLMTLIILSGVKTRSWRRHMRIEKENIIFGGKMKSASISVFRYTDRQQPVR